MGPRSAPPAPAMPDLPGSLPRVTPWGPALRGGWQRGQDPPGLQVQEAPAGRSSPSPPSLPGTAMLPALREGHSPNPPTLLEHCTPVGLCRAPQGRGAAGAVPARDRVLRWGSPHTAALPSSRTLGSAGRKSRRYRAAGCSPCLSHGLWPEISWHGHHGSVILGFVFSSKGGPSQRDTQLPPDP